MKLISCHIENYGSLSRFDYKFDGGFNQFYSSNGRGKSTFASFIKAMFYGLPTDTARSKFNERRHFYPFSGGKFGGSITFEWKGALYRVERLFSRTGTTGDEARVFENNYPSERFAAALSAGREIGEVVFGLDEQSFVRTLFFNSEKSEMCSTGGINAKLNDYLALTDGETSFEDALESLDKAAKNLKARGGKGRIAELEAKVKQCRSDIAAIGEISSALDARYSELSAVNSRISSLERQENEHNKMAEVMQKWARYDDFVAAAERGRAKIAQIEGAYPAGMPSEKDAAELNAAVARTAELNAKIQSSSFGENKKARLEELERFFGDNVPDGATLDGMAEKLKKRASDEAYIKAAEEQSDSHYEKLCAIFSSGEPDDESMRNCADAVEEYKKITSSPARAPKTKVASVAMLFAALACAAGAVGLFALKFVPVGIVLLCAAAACLIAAGATYFSSRKNSHAAPSAGDLEERIKNFLAPYNADMSEGPVFAFGRLRDDLKEYRALKEKYASRNASLGERKKEVSALGEEIEKFLSAYKPQANGDEAKLAEIRSLSEEYASLKNQRSASRAAVAALKGELDGLEATAGGILTRYNLGGRSYSGAASQIHADISERERLLADVAEAEKNAEAFKKKYELSERPTAETGRSCAEELSSLRRRLAVLNREISEDEAVCETLGEKQNALSNAQEELALCRQKYETYTAATEFLKLAEHSLNEKYVAPIKDRFASYAEALKSVLGGEVYMDRNFAITYEGGGETRSDEHLSSGQRAVVAFCFRLALVDNIFGDDTPFIVMDDPFADLDEEHLARAAKLISKLSEDRQIIYFCCHESRKMK